MRKIECKLTACYQKIIKLPLCYMSNYFSSVHRNSLNATTILLAPLLKPTDIISSHNVYSEIECLFNCVNKKGCGGFKYKSITNRESKNCHLSKPTGKNTVAYHIDQGWEFFIDTQNISARNLKFLCTNYIK